jgi:hypothetical protein
MSNYMMINGSRIPLSEETAKELEKQFGKNSIRKYLGNTWLGKEILGTFSPKIYMTSENDGKRLTVFLPLPNSNPDWTFSAWDSAKEIFHKCKKLGGNVQIRHDHDAGTQKNIVIQIDL